MKETPVLSLGAPGSFLLTDKTDPLYYIARLSHEQSMNLYAMETAGFRLEQDEDTDVTGMQTILNTWFSDLDTWMLNAATASDAGLPVPAPPAPPTLPGKTIEGILLTLFIKLVVRLVVSWLEKKLNPDKQAGEIAQILKDALIASNGTGEYPILTQLANTPLEIILSKSGDYVDFFYSDRPET
jgi:hypothetical protein